jgi:hypothetical protein
VPVVDHRRVAARAVADEECRAADARGGHAVQHRDCLGLPAEDAGGVGLQARHRHRLEPSGSVELRQHARTDPSFAKFADALLTSVAGARAKTYTPPLLPTSAAFMRSRLSTVSVGSVSAPVELAFVNNATPC